MKLAFIDHSFHKKSTATSFLINLLQCNYEIDVFWDDSWLNGSRVDLRIVAANSYDVVVFFQQIKNYTADEMRQCGSKNIVMVPMYDMCRNWSDRFWLKYRDFKIISFSQHLHHRLQALGMNTRYFQFYLPPCPENLDKTQNGFHGFFWHRTSGITWKQIRFLIGDSVFQSFHLHVATDPPGFGQIIPSDEEIRRHSLVISNWFERRDDYFAALSKATIFFTPRLYEGIGMSFIEAIARGMLVVAPDLPTVNEYIRHDFNGILYNPVKPVPIDFFSFERLRENIRISSVEGYNRWVESAPQLLSFINEEPHPGKQLTCANRFKNSCNEAVAISRHLKKKLFRKIDR